MFKLYLYGIEITQLRQNNGFFVFKLYLYGIEICTLNTFFRRF